jgi:outer membrane protein TolC
MKHFTRLGYLAVLMGASLAAPAHADCIYPKAPAEALPNGATATEQEMVAAMKGLKVYNDAVTAYLSCLDVETSSRIAEAGPDTTADQVKQIRALEEKKHNAAVDELQSRAEEFNKQVRAYKTKKKG